MIELKNRFTGAVVYRSESATTVREAVIEAASRALSLRGAYLRGAYLRDADLGGAYLRDADLGDADLGGADLGDADLGGAYLGGAYLGGAYLRDADLGGAYLRGADLRGADLGDADLGDAYLRGADLRGIRDDLYEVLAAAPAEVPGLLDALRSGRVDGTTYTGECSCLVGTIAHVRRCRIDDLPDPLRPDSTRPAECWFLAIRPGDRPDNHPVAKVTDEWIEQWLRDQGREVPEAINVGEALAFARVNRELFERFVAGGHQ